MSFFTGNLTNGDPNATNTMFTSFVGTLTGTASDVLGSAVISKPLTGFAPASGTVLATDSILNAFNKVAGNITSLATATSTLNGDVTGLSTSNTVVSVGGKTASVVATSVNDTTNATSLNTANKIVKRDAVGNVICSNFVGNLIGTASRISDPLSGDVQGTQAATRVATVGGQTASSIVAATIAANNATDANTFGQIVKRDNAGNFSANIITALQLNGNASTATQANFCSQLPTVTGEVYNTGNNIYLRNTNVIGKVLTGFTPAPGAVQATDTILNAFNKVVGNINTLTAPSGGSVVTLNGDVTSNLIGNAVVNSVGGRTAAEIAAAVSWTQTGSISNIPNSLLLRDSAGSTSVYDLTATNSVRTPLIGTSTANNCILESNSRGNIELLTNGNTTFNGDAVVKNGASLVLNNVTNNNSISLTSPSSLTASATYSLPAILGITNQVLTLSNTTGQMTWATPAVAGAVTLTGGVTSDVFGVSTVNSVGGYAASAVTGILDQVMLATSNATSNTIMKRDANSDIVVRDLTMRRLKTPDGAICFNVNSENTFVGACGNTTASGLGNFVGGSLSGAQLSSGSNNVCLGKSAGTNITVGNSNIAIGTLALPNAYGASNNTAIGYGALLLGSGNDSIAVGSFAGQMMTTGAQCTYLGYGADLAADGTITNATALGYNAKVAASNTIQLGNANVTNVNTSGALSASSITTGDLTSTLFFIRNESFSTQVLNNCMTFIQMEIPNGGAFLEIAMVVDSSGFSLSKHYTVPITWNIMGGVWKRLIPRVSSKANSEDVDLDVYVLDGSLRCRAVRTQGSTVGTVNMKVVVVGVSPSVYTSLRNTFNDYTVPVFYLDGCEKLQQTLTGNWAGGVSFSGSNVMVSRNGKQCLLSLQPFTVTSSSNASSNFSVALPYWAYPSSNLSGSLTPIVAMNNNGAVIGYCSISSSTHIISIYVDGGWQAGTTCGLPGGVTVSYIVD
jgi:hypothetical protein